MSDYRSLKAVDPDVYQAIADERSRQNFGLELIASENFVSRAVLEAAGSVLTNKYAEGYPGRRYYGGCELVDVVERLAIERAKQLFGAEHVNVQPHSGTSANMAVYFAVLRPGDKLMGMDLSCGGHLTHGHRLSYSGRDFQVVAYGVDRESEQIDYDEVERLALQERPKLIVVGASAYSRVLDFERFRAIADQAGALVMADIAHIAGLVAAGLHPSPVPHCHFVTTTTHKTLRGPRGGMVLTDDEAIAKKINSAVFPGMQGGPLTHIIAAKAVALGEALRPEFKAYARAVVDNARVLAESLTGAGFDLVSGGTDTHLMLVDLRAKKLTGNIAEKALGRAHITVNKNSVPFDTAKPTVTSGIRLGSPAGTTRGFGPAEFKLIGRMIAEVLDGLAANGEAGNAGVEARVKAEAIALTKRFPMYE